MPLVEHFESVGFGGVCLFGDLKDGGVGAFAQYGTEVKVLR